MPPKLQRRVSFETLTAEEAIEDGEAEDCEVLIVDPPRKVMGVTVVTPWAVDDARTSLCEGRHVFGILGHSVLHAQGTDSSVIVPTALISGRVNYSSRLHSG